MADKNEDKNAQYWDEKLASKLPDLKSVVRMFGAVNKNAVFPDEETFLVDLLRMISQRIGSRADWLAGAISQPNSYEQMLAYKYLKESEKLTETRKLAEKMIALALRIDISVMDSKSKKDDLIELYKNITDDIFSMETEYINVTKFVLENLEKDKDTKEKDVYIG